MSKFRPNNTQNIQKGTFTIQIEYSIFHKSPPKSTCLTKSDNIRFYRFCHEWQNKESKIYKTHFQSINKRCQIRDMPLSSKKLLKSVYIGLYRFISVYIGSRMKQFHSKMRLNWVDVCSTMFTWDKYISMVAIVFKIKHNEPFINTLIFPINNAIFLY